MHEKLQNIIKNGIHSCVLSQLKKGIDCQYTKVLIRPFLKGEETLFQLTYTFPKKVTHENLTLSNLCQRLEELLKTTFHQCIIFGNDKDYHITYFGSMKLKTSVATKTVTLQSHNRQKNYVLSPEEGADFLVELGIVKNGIVAKEKYDKFRQINRYLEFIRDIVSALPKDKVIKIVDFGCGKAYLTFALYYYLTQKLGLQADILGLDLKTDVVQHCQALADRLGYDHLRFQAGDIGTYDATDPFDMVISLHACDTATDEAIYKGILWRSRVILAVPCCQHELNPQLVDKGQSGILDYGIVRERLATLLTDTARALLMEDQGYQTDLAEFIDLEHTPKNILIRGIRTGKANKAALQKYKNLKAAWQFEHRLEQRLHEK